jgi:gluconate 2-dehydrogenase subunit 3-like protein
MDEISRRQFMEVVAASAAAGIVLPTAISGASPDAAGLPADQIAVLTAVLNRLIPATRDVPGAGDLGIAAFIQAAAAAAPHIRPHIDAILTAASEAQPAGLSPDDCGSELDTVLKRLERVQNESFDLLLQAAYTGYYSHPRVLSALQWVDPSDESHQPPPFDVTLLAAVRRRAGLTDTA